MFALNSGRGFFLCMSKVRVVQFISEVTYFEQKKRAVAENYSCSKCDSSELYQFA